MEKSRPLIGLALGAGGVKGFAHIGVLRELEKNQIPIDMIAGSSIGALIAALYGVGHSPSTLETFTRLFNQTFYLDFTLPKQGFIQGERIKHVIRMLSHHKHLEELNIPVGVVATDLHSGEAVVFRQGPVADTVRASISIPGVFVPYSYKGRLFVDGGVADRLPIRTVKEMGADITIAVDVSFYNHTPNIRYVYDVILQSMDIMGKEFIRMVEKEADVFIRPKVTGRHLIDFKRAEEYITYGRTAMNRQLNELKRKIAQWKENNNDRESNEKNNEQT